MTSDFRQDSSVEGGTANFDRAVAFRSAAISLTFNALCPYLLFRILEPRFPGESIMPLLCSTAFPVIGFLAGIVRHRAVNAIAAIALAGIVIQIAMTIVSRNLSNALVARSLDGTIIGLCFLLSAAIGRPIILTVARQLVTAGAPQNRSRFDAVVALDGGRAFSIATTVWGLCLVILSSVNIVLALTLPHGLFVLLSPILAIVTNLVLLGWSMRYTTRRLASHLRTGHGPAAGNAS